MQLQLQKKYNLIDPETMLYIQNKRITRNKNVAWSDVLCLVWQET